MENRLVPPTGIAIDRLAFSGLRGKGLVGNAARRAAPARRVLHCLAAHLRGAHADAVLGMGGYVCFPGGWMAWLHRKPLLLVNADATLLLSNRALRRAARPHRLRLRRRVGARPAARRRSSPATRCASEIEALPEPARALRRPQRRAAPARRRRQPRRARPQRHACRRRSRCIDGDAAAAGHAPDRRSGTATPFAPPTPQPAPTPRCCPSSTTWRRASASAT